MTQAAMRGEVERFERLGQRAGWSPWVLAAIAAVLALPVMAGAQPTPSAERYAFSHAQMGTTFRLVVYAPDRRLAATAAAAAFARLDTLNAHLSDYLAESELSRLSRTGGSGQAVPLSAGLYAVLAEAQRWASATDGAFDVTVGPVTRLWRWAARRGQWPPPERLAEARAAVGHAALHLDPHRQTATLRRPGMRLDLGGIAKGYAADTLLAVLRRHGLSQALVDAGGDVVAGAPPPGQPGWQVVRPAAAAGSAPDTLLLAHAALATSGDTFRYVELDGVRYSHLVDPRTGLGLTHRQHVTVRAPTGTQADALASAFSVLDADARAALLAQYPAVTVWVVPAPAGVPVP